jgi:hypothetical protein
VQTVDCTVRIGGSLNHEVNKFGLTIPEIVVLQQIHGRDGVVNVKPRKDVRIGSDVIFAALCGTYGEQQVRTAFPGAHPQFPKTIKEIGFSEDGVLLDAFAEGDADFADA